MLPVPCDFWAVRQANNRFSSQELLSLMNFEGFSPHEFDRWSSLVEQDDPTALPQGVAGVARNVCFRLNSVRTRDGISWQFQSPTKDQPITGLASLINQQPTGSTQVPLILDIAGRMYVESPAGSGTLVPGHQLPGFAARECPHASSSGV